MGCAALAKLLPNAGATIEPTSATSFLVLADPAKPLDQSGVLKLNQQIVMLLGTLPSTAPFQIELKVPHAATIPSLMSRLVAIDPQLSVRLSALDTVMVTAANSAQPDCMELTRFLQKARDLAWSTHPESPEGRLQSSSLSSDVVVKALTGSVPPSTPPSDGKNADTASAKTANVSPAVTIMVTPTSPPKATTQVGSGKGGKATPKASTPSGDATSLQAAPATNSKADSPAAPAAAPPSAAASPSSVGIGSIAPDTLLFASSLPGDDEAIEEKKRILALLNLPRPEMALSAWSIQNSSADERTVSESSRLVREEVSTYNDGLAQMLGRGWTQMRTDAEKRGFFDRVFYSYIADRVVYEGGGSQSAQAILGEQTATSDLKNNTADARKRFGICPVDRYCLGYASLLKPLHPRLMDLLLAMIAAARPIDALRDSVNAAEGTTDSNHPTPCSKDSEDDLPCKIWKRLYPVEKTRPVSSSALNCQAMDYADILSSIKINARKPKPHLNCFRNAAEMVFRPDSPELDLLRASIADFLFNYKISQQYPHEFVPYDLNSSATAMNSALRPLIDSFVQDVDAYQAVLKRKLGLQIDEMNKGLSQHSFQNKPRFFENAIVTVNTVAGYEASVDTTTESYLEEINAPTLSALAGAVAGSGSSATGTSGLGALLSGSRLNEFQAIAGGLSQFQTSHVHLGRELSLDVKPTALLGANSAELQVTLKADDTSGSGAYSDGGMGDAQISRFSKSETATTVRVDSLKLFEVSSFASQLTTPKKKFPLLPPFVELPYIGSIVSLPLPPSREFHSSIAIVSAVVIPTSADLAYSARFISDRILADTGAGTPCTFWNTVTSPELGAKGSPCKTRRMISLSDFGPSSPHEFNRVMVQCLATGKKHAFSSYDGTEKDSGATCQDLTFANLTSDIN